MHRADNDEILSSFGRRWTIKNHWMLMEQKPFLHRCLPPGEQSQPVQCQVLASCCYSCCEAGSERSCVWILPELGRAIA